MECRSHTGAQSPAAPTFRAAVMASSLASSVRCVLVTLFLCVVSSEALNYGPPTVKFSVTKWNAKSGITLSASAAFAGNGSYVTLLGPTPSQNSAGGVFRTKPVSFVDPHTKKAASFSTSFTFAITPDNGNTIGDGLAFVIKPTPAAAVSDLGEYLGIFDPNVYSNGDPAIKTVAVEIDTFQNTDFDDPSVPHFGLDVNSIVSVATATGDSLVVESDDPQKVTVWVDYNAKKHVLTVSAAKAPAKKSQATRLISYKSFDLASIVNPSSYVGFTSATGFATENNFVYSWSFSTFF